MPLGLSSWWPLLLLPAIPLGWWLARRGRRGMSRQRFVLVHTLRALAVLCAIAALAGPSVHSDTDALSVVYALDVSHSVAAESLRGALRWVQESNARYHPAHTRFLVFADRARLLSRVEDIERVSTGNAGAAAAGALDQNATDLERALAASLAGFHPGYVKRLVLISDGKQTQGDVWRQVPRLRAQRVRVYALPAPTGYPAQAWIDGFDLPAGIRAQAPVTARVRLIAAAAMHARVEVKVADEVRLSRSVALEAGRNDVAVELRFAQSGTNAVRITLAAADGRTDTRVDSVWVGPRVRLLYLEGGRTGARYLADALVRQGIDVRPTAPARLAEDPAGALRGIDAVLLSDVSAEQLGDEAAGALQRFVRDQGGGLIFVAGENTYGKGGFSGSTLERMLPIKFEARRKHQELDLVLLLDRSFSMSGRKLELAKSAALATLDLMEEQQRLAVVAFDSKPHDVVALARVGSKRRAEDAIGRMTAAGRTDVYNALWRARELLKTSQAKAKHVILLTDGQTVPPPNAGAAAAQVAGRTAMLEMLHGMGYGKGRIERLLGDDAPARPAAAIGGFEELVAGIAAAGITLSTVAIGEKPNLALLTALAEQGKGRSYIAQRDSEIPALFVSEARRLLGEALVEGPFRPLVVARSEVLSGVDFKTGPELKGFVAARPKQFSDVLLQASGKAPLLVETRYGLGKTVAFLSDAKNRWAAQWLPWSGYGRFWSQVVRDAARGLGSQGLTWEVRRRRSTGLIQLTALNPDGSFRNDLWPQVRMLRPDGSSTVVGLRQSAPGTYAARVVLQASTLAPFGFELLAGPGVSAEETAQLGLRSLHYPQADELRPQPPDLALLKALSERTGGKFAPATEAIFAPSADRGRLAWPLWPLLAAAALLLVLLEIAARRVRWPALDAAPLR